MKTILIIGAGFSGAVVAAQLLRQHNGTPLRIVLVNGSGRVARGMAYGTQSSDHTLNVPAGNMSAYDGVPDHFLRFAHARDSLIHAGSFVSRSLYGDYLEWLLAEAEQQSGHTAAAAHLQARHQRTAIPFQNDSDTGVWRNNGGRQRRPGARPLPVQPSADRRHGVL